MSDEMWSTRIARAIAEIDSKRDTFQNLADKYRSGPPLNMARDKYNTSELRKNAFGNILIKSRLIIENNFHALETISTLATARYMLELCIWARLLELDEMYGLACTVQQFETQAKYYRDYANQLELEVKQLNRSVMRKRGEGNTSADTSDSMFYVYGDEISEHGAEIIYPWLRSNPYKMAKASLIEAEAERDKYLSGMSDDQKAFMRKIKRWNWKRMAEIAGMRNEYEFAYTFSSKLIHASPVSFMTNQKDFELSEACLFVRFIAKKLEDIRVSAEGTLLNYQ